MHAANTDVQLGPPGPGSFPVPTTCKTQPQLTDPRQWSKWINRSLELLKATFPNRANTSFLGWVGVVREYSYAGELLPDKFCEAQICHINVINSQVIFECL